jgi:hypothetical protein
MKENTMTRPKKEHIASASPSAHHDREFNVKLGKWV